MKYALAVLTIALAIATLALYRCGEAIMYLEAQVAASANCLPATDREVVAIARNGTTLECSITSGVGGRRAVISRNWYEGV